MEPLRLHAFFSEASAGEKAEGKEDQGKDGKRASSVQSFFQGSASSMPSKLQFRSGGNGYLRIHASHLVDEGVRFKQEVGAQGRSGISVGSASRVILRRLVNGPQPPHGWSSDGGEDGDHAGPRRGLPRRSMRDCAIRDGGLVFRVCPHVQGQRHARIHSGRSQPERKRAGSSMKSIRFLRWCGRDFQNWSACPRPGNR